MTTRPNANGNRARTLDIGGMAGSACVQRVWFALGDVRGIKTHAVSLGSAEIESDQAACDAACNAIGRAGYKPRERRGELATENNARAREIADRDRL